MNWDTLNIKKLLFVCLLTVGLKSYSQDTTFKFSLDTTLLDFSTWTKFQMPFDYLYQSPDDNDRKAYKKYSHLIHTKPTLKNYDKYYHLACSLWDLEKLQEAEQMFLSITNSTEKQYSTTYYHSSDVPGDTTTNTYGYGGYTSSYKNGAAIYLTKINIKKKQFQKAFKYLEDATNKYKVTYSCGTGYRQQKDEYDFLYACCYEGLNKPNKIIELLLPECLNKNDGILLRAIRKMYSPNEIKECLLKAETSLDCSFYTIPSYAFQTIYNSEKNTEKTDTLVYYSGSATINMFDKTINIPTPALDNNERVTKEHFMKEFKESSFYIELSKVAGLSQHTTSVLPKAGLKL